MAGYPPQYGRNYPMARDSYSAPSPVTQQPGGYPTYPGPAQPIGPPVKYEKQYDNRGYQEDPRYYDGPQTRGPKPYMPQLPDSPPAGMNGREWSSGLFDCTSDVQTCVCVWCCSPFYQMYRAHEFGESCWNFTPCCLGTTLSTLVLRHRMREREGIRGSLMKDCMAVTFCGSCVSCQLLRENDLVRGGGNGGGPMGPMGPPPRPGDRY